MSAQGPYSRITSRLVPGLGSSPDGARYAYSDTELTNGVTYFYHVSTSTWGLGSILYFISEGAAANRHGVEAVYELELGVAGERMTPRSARPRGDPARSRR